MRVKQHERDANLGMSFGPMLRDSSWTS